MQCPMTKFDCITCEDKCLLQERRQQADPFRRGNDLRTCDAELIRYGMKDAPSYPVYSCRLCGRESRDGYRRECCGEMQGV